jgi:putative oxidoreductase
MNMRAVLSSGVEIEGALTNVALVVVRFFAGISLAFQHGIHKIPPTEKFIASVSSLGFPLAHVFAWAAGISEFVGGLLLVVGLCTRPASFFILFTMAVAIFARHWSGPFAEKELAVLYAAIALAFLLTGSGRMGIDDSLRRRLSS